MSESNFKTRSREESI
ncbi:hypothetical protein [Robinsoniella peoriensis]